MTDHIKKYDGYKENMFHFLFDGHEYFLCTFDQTVYDVNYNPVATWTQDPGKEHWIVESIDKDLHDQFHVNGTSLIDAIKTVL